MKHRICPGGFAALAVTLTSTTALAGSPIYTTGPADGLRGWLSTTQPSGSAAFSADDFVLPTGNGQDYLVTAFSGEMFLTVPTPPPDIQAILYADNGGSPGGMMGAFDATVVIDSGVAGPATLPATRRYEVTADGLGLFLSPNTRYWLSWHASGAAQGTSAGYFATAGNGVVQGEEGHFIGPAFGANNWTPLSDRPGGAASDLAFSVFGSQFVPTPGAALLLGSAGLLAGVRRRRA